MRRRLLFWVSAAAFWSAACVSGPSTRPIEPGDHVALRPAEGLLVVHIRTNRRIASLRISGARAAEDVPEGTHVRLIGVGAGSYRWSDVHLREYWRPTPGFRYPDADRLRFRVEPGVINYVGMVDIHRGGEFAVEINSIDRTAMALEDLRKRYPALTAKYPIVYSGPARHVFLERLSRGGGAAGSGRPRKRVTRDRGFHGGFHHRGSFVQDARAAPGRSQPIGHADLRAGIHL